MGFHFNLPEDCVHTIVIPPKYTKAVEVKLSCVVQSNEYQAGMRPNIPNNGVSGFLNISPASSCSRSQGSLLNFIAAILALRFRMDRCNANYAKRCRINQVDQCIHPDVYHVTRELLTLRSQLSALIDVLTEDQ